MAEKKILWRLPGESQPEAPPVIAVPTKERQRKRPRDDARPTKEGNVAAEHLQARKRPRPPRASGPAAAPPAAAAAAPPAAGRAPEQPQAREGSKRRQRPPKKPAQLKDNPERSARRMEINKELSEHAKLKRLGSAVECLARAEAEGLDNEFTWAIAINAYVRCGDVSGAEQLLQRMRAKGFRPGVVAFTSLLKGLCSAGEMPKAADLLAEMAAAKTPPNVRTVNTFLRGCVHSGDPERAASCLEAMERKWKVMPDASTLEMTAQLLCQALRLPEAQALVLRLRADDEARDWSSVAVAATAVARAAALSGLSEAVQKALSEASAAVNADERSENGSGGSSQAHGNSGGADDGGGGAQQQAGRGVAGGKRAWRESEARAASGRLFAAHRRDALRRELKQLRAFVSSGQEVDLKSEQRRLLSFDGDGRNGALPTGAPALHELMRRKFGVAAAGNAAGDAMAALLAAVVSKEGRLDISRLLSESSKSKQSSGSSGSKKKAREQEQLPLKVEICCGDGAWAIEQAAADAGLAHWCAVDIRHDRCHRAWASSVFRGVPNLAVLAGDALWLLERRLPPAAISHVCVNFPEPPQQANDDLHTDAAHLLTPAFFLAVRSALRAGGTATVVTDSLWYGRLLLSIVQGLPEGTFAPVKAKLLSNGGARAVSAASSGSSGLALYAGTPPAEACGAPAPAAASYFERLKAKEKGQRGQRQGPYFICVQRPPGCVDRGTVAGESETKEQKKERRREKNKKARASEAKGA